MLNTTLNLNLSQLATNLFSKEISKVIPYIKGQEVSSRKRGLKQLLAILEVVPSFQREEVLVSEGDFKAYIKGLALPKDKSNLIWSYRDTQMSVIAYNTLSYDKVLKEARVMKMLSSILLAVLVNSNRKITFSEAVEIIASEIKVSHIKVGEGMEVTSNQWMKLELACQLLAIFAELSILSVYKGQKIHMVSIPVTLDTGMTDDELSELSYQLTMNTRKKPLMKPDLQVSEGDTPRGYLTKKSWHYKAQPLSKAQALELNILNSIRYKFIPNAEEKIEEAFKAHLKVDELPLWGHARLSEFKTIIRESMANGGHYISHKADSALRTYGITEVGSKSSSKALRSLVAIDGINNPIKKDLINNAMQIYALALGSKGLWGKVNVVRQQILADFNSELGSSLAYDDFKPIMMVWQYTAGDNRLLDGVEEVNFNPFTGDKITKVKTPGLRELVKRSGVLANDEDIIQTFWNCVNKHTPEICVLLDVYKGLAKANQFTETQWTLPDGSVAQLAAVELEDRVLHFYTADGRKHQHTHYKKVLKAGAGGSGLAPRHNQSIDAYIKRQFLIRMNKIGAIVVPNHDSFIFDKSYEEKGELIMKELFVEVLERKVSSSLYNQCNPSGYVYKLDKALDITPLTREDIMSSQIWKDEDM